MKVLDLFSGGQSLRKPCEDLGHEYFSIDIDPSNNPDMVADIGKLNFRDIPFRTDVIWASPPCTCFSVSSIGKHWNINNTPKTNNTSKKYVTAEDSKRARTYIAVRWLPINGLFMKHTDISEDEKVRLYVYKSDWRELKNLKLEPGETFASVVHHVLAVFIQNTEG